MLEYINNKRKEIYETFVHDYNVILVEVFSVNPALKDKLIAITDETAGYMSMNEAIKKYDLKHDTTISIGITTKCLDEMEKIQQQQAKGYAEILEKNKQKFAEENFGCLLALFLGFVLFIILCLVWSF